MKNKERELDGCTFAPKITKLKAQRKQRRNENHLEKVSYSIEESKSKLKESLEVSNTGRKQNRSEVVSK